MNENRQKIQIIRFLKQKKNKNVDVFCLYQWIDRCYYQGWWDLGAQLASFIPFGSLNSEYQKRVNFLFSECKKKLSDQFIELKNPGGKKLFRIPRTLWEICENVGLKLAGKSERWLRLEHNGTRIIILEKIKPDGCYLKFMNISRNILADWLSKNGFIDLIDGIIPKGDNQRNRVWLKASWENVANLIPIWTRSVIRDQKIEKEKTVHTGKNALFYKNLLDGFNEILPNITKRIALNQSWLSMPVGYHRIHFEWVIRKKSNQFRVALHFEYPKYEKNKNIFDFFHAKKEALQINFPEDEIVFENKWGKQWSQIYVKRDGFDYSQESIWWGVNRMVNFYESIKPVIDEYFSKQI